MFVCYQLNLIRPAHTQCGFQNVVQLDFVTQRYHFENISIEAVFFLGTADILIWWNQGLT